MSAQDQIIQEVFDLEGFIPNPEDYARWRAYLKAAEKEAKWWLVLGLPGANMVGATCDPDEAAEWREEILAGEWGEVIVMVTTGSTVHDDECYEYPPEVEQTSEWKKIMVCGGCGAHVPMEFPHSKIVCGTDGYSEVPVITKMNWGNYSNYPERNASGWSPVRRP